MCVSVFPVSMHCIPCILAFSPRGQKRPPDSPESRVMDIVNNVYAEKRFQVLRKSNKSS